MSLGFQQTNELWQDIQTETSQDKKRQKMIEMASLLIHYAQLTDSDLNAISQSDELTALFLAYQKIGGLTAQFIHQTLPHLDPELTDFKDQLLNLSQELQDYNQTYHALHEQHSQLLSMKTHLQNAKTKLTELENELKALKHLESEVQPNKMAELEQTIKTLKQSTDAIRPDYERLITEKDRMNTLLESMKQMQNRGLNKDNPEQIAQLISQAQNLSEKLDAQWDECDIYLAQELRKLTKHLAMYRDGLQKLETCLIELNQTVACETANQTLYDLHFQANTQLVQSINQEQIQDTSIPQQIQKAKKISDQIQVLLKQFDQLLREMIVNNETKHEEIRRLNKTKI